MPGEDGTETHFDPATGINFAKSHIDVCNPGVDFVVSGITLGQRVAKIGESVHSVETFPTATWCIMHHEHGLLRPDGRTKVTAGIREHVSTALHTNFLLYPSLRVQSSASRKSLIIFFLILVFTWNLLELNGLPSEQHLSWMPASLWRQKTWDWVKTVPEDSLGWLRERPCRHCFGLAYYSGSGATRLGPVWVSLCTLYTVLVYTWPYEKVTTDVVFCGGGSFSLVT